MKKLLIALIIVAAGCVDTSGGYESSRITCYTGSDGIEICTQTNITIDNGVTNIETKDCGSLGSLGVCP